MSILHEKSPKHCAAKHGLSSHLPHLHKKFFFLLSTLLILLLSLIFLVWLLLHPSNPSFFLRQTEILQLDYLPSPLHLLNSSIELTLFSRNPNSKVSIYYDEFQVYASYKGQQITLHSSLSPFYQGKKEANVITTAIGGSGVPVAASFASDIARDQTVGKLCLTIKVSGRIRWKVGTWVSGRYRLNVNCLAVMDLGPTIPMGPVSTKQGSQCSTII